VPPAHGSTFEAVGAPQAYGARTTAPAIYVVRPAYTSASESCLPSGWVGHLDPISQIVLARSGHIDRRIGTAQREGRSEKVHLLAGGNPPRETDASPGWNEFPLIAVPTTNVPSSRGCLRAQRNASGRKQPSTFRLENGPALRVGWPVCGKVSGARCQASGDGCQGSAPGSSTMRLRYFSRPFPSTHTTYLANATSFPILTWTYGRKPRRNNLF